MGNDPMHSFLCRASTRPPGIYQHSVLPCQEDSARLTAWLCITDLGRPHHARIIPTFSLAARIARRSSRSRKGAVSFPHFFIMCFGSFVDRPWSLYFAAGKAISDMIKRLLSLSSTDLFLIIVLVDWWRHCCSGSLCLRPVCRIW